MYSFFTSLIPKNSSGKKNEGEKALYEANGDPHQTQENPRCGSLALSSPRVHFYNAKLWPGNPPVTGPARGSPVSSHKATGGGGQADFGGAGRGQGACHRNWWLSAVASWSTFTTRSRMQRSLLSPLLIHGVYYKAGAPWMNMGQTRQ